MEHVTYISRVEMVNRPILDILRLWHCPHHPDVTICFFRVINYVTDHIMPAVRLLINRNTDDQERRT